LRSELISSSPSGRPANLRPLPTDASFLAMNGRTRNDKVTRKEKLGFQEMIGAMGKTVGRVKIKTKAQITNGTESIVVRAKFERTEKRNIPSSERKQASPLSSSK